MSTPAKHILSQGPVLATLARTAVTALHRRHVEARPDTFPSTPGPELRQRIAKLPTSLVRDYIRHVGGDPSAYAGRVPHTMFPQWTFPLAAQTLRDLPVPLHKIINAGCKLELRAPLPADEAWFATARLESLEHDGRRLHLHQRITTSTTTCVDALVAHIHAMVPLPSQETQGAKGRQHREPARVPTGATEVARWSLRPSAGLDFALLTGDFNPVHWVPAYARMLGFKNTILHGFSTMARTLESLQRNLLAGSTQRLASLDVRFRRPLIVPARVGVYVEGNAVFVGDAAGGPAYLSGTFELRPPGDLV